MLETEHNLAARLGFEPRLPGPEPGVLPLYDLAIINRINYSPQRIAVAQLRIFQDFRYFLIAIKLGTIPRKTPTKSCNKNIMPKLPKNKWKTLISGASDFIFASKV